MKLTIYLITACCLFYLGRYSAVIQPLPTNAPDTIFFSTELNDSNLLSALRAFEVKCQEIVLKGAKNYKTHPVTVTVYNATAEQCGNTPTVTAFGNKISDNPYSHKYCAVSPDLVYLKNQTIFIVAGYLTGWYKVADRTSSRLTNTVDILINEDMPIGMWNGSIITRRN